MMTCFETVIYADNTQPMYAITDDVVIIDSVSYEIVDNTIQYDGKTYMIKDYTLITYDEKGDPVYFVLPVEQNKVSDPMELAALNATIGKGNSLTRDIPSYAEELPYTADVPEGQWYTMTPAVRIPLNPFYPGINLQLSDFPLFADERFSIIYSCCDSLGNWYSTQVEQDFFFDKRVRFENASHIEYGVFSITNLYGNPSPKYTYSIYLSLL